MVRSKVTGPKTASKAARVLRSTSASIKAKSAAGSALSQTKAPAKATSKSAASAASRVLRDGMAGKAAKSAAGSALSQRASSKKSRGRGPKPPKKRIGS